MTSPLVGTEIIGGPQKRKYWTPDGREILAVPSMRGYRSEKGDGVRDANLDNGWLLEKPVNPKLRCPHCDKWHDKKVEIIKCGKDKKAVQLKFDAIAKRELTKNAIAKDTEIGSLKAQVDELKDLVNKLLAKGVA